MSIEQEVSDYIVENFLLGDRSRLDPAKSLLESGIIDSTGVLELVGLIEQKLGIKMADEEIVPDNLDSIENIVRFIARKQAAANVVPKAEVAS